MRQQYKNSYQFAKPPQALLKARLDNIAIVPASMLPFQKTLQELINTLPQGAVFLCHAEENTRQRKLLERVEETFRQQGHAVMNLSMEEVYKATPNF
jgi:hypothetical protein